MTGTIVTGTNGTNGTNGTAQAPRRAGQRDGYRGVLGTKTPPVPIVPLGLSRSLSRWERVPLADGILFVEPWIGHNESGAPWVRCALRCENSETGNFRTFYTSWNGYRFARSATMSRARRDVAWDAAGALHRVLSRPAA